MKYILLIILVTISLNCFSDQYVVEFDKATKKQVSSYTLKDGEAVTTTNPYVLVTAEEYALLGDATAWDKNTTDWLKKADNAKKVDDAITASASVKTDKEKLAELEAKVAALEAKEVK